MKKRVKARVKSKPKISKFLYWTPRVLSILFLLFLAMFSLDIFGNNYGFWGVIVGLFMHNIPVFVLAFFLWLAWKREWIGTIIFTGAGLLYIGFIVFDIVNTGFQGYYLGWILNIACPAFVIAFLFWLNWKKRKK